MTDFVVDTSALLAFFDASEPDHASVDGILRSPECVLIVSPYIVAELDYLVASRHGVRAELAVIDELSRGSWTLAEFGADDLKQAHSIIASYDDQDIGLADASNVVLAERYRTRSIVTLDHRHFDMLRPLSGGRFSVLPHMG